MKKTFTYILVFLISLFAFPLQPLAEEIENGLDNEIEIIDIDNSSSDDEEYIIEPEIIDNIKNDELEITNNNENEIIDNIYNNEDVIINESNDEIIDNEQSNDAQTPTVDNNYQVTFTHDGYHISIAGGSSILLSQLNQKLNIDIQLSDVTEITVSDSSIISINRVNDSNDYTIKSLKSFNTEETLIIKTVSGDEYIIKVTDPVGDDPEHSKDLIDNHDGTYTLELTVTGEAEKKVNKVNVIVILDRSGSMDDSSGTSEETYTPTSSTSTGLYGLIDGQYVPLSRRGGMFNRTFWYNDVQYTGQRYTRSVANQSRLEAAQAAVDNLAESLLANNGVDGNPNDTVEIALISFSNSANIASNTPTTSLSTFQNIVNGLSANGGTNWEAALKQVANVNFGDNDTTYVIFVTDGAPTFYSTNANHGDYNSRVGVYGTGQEEEPNMEYSYDAAVDDASTIVTTYGASNFYTIFAYGESYGADYLKDLTTSAGAPAGNNYSAANTAALQAAFHDILSQIEMAGFGSVSINDGTTANVTTSTGVSHLLDVDETSFQYYTGNKDTDTWTPWEDAPEAELVDGEVKWDLSSVGVLENGLTYKVTFRVWPSEETLDLIADLKNHPEHYDDLDDNVKTYLYPDGNGEYILKTNTTAILKFTDTRADNPSEDSAPFDDPDPVSTIAAQSLSISKEWENDLDGRNGSEVTLNVLQDGNVWNSIVLNSGNQYHASTYISVGIMTVDKNGNVNILVNGHDYSFGELGSDVYNWELTSDIVHPMIINGELTILFNEGTTVPENGTYYKIGDYYYVVGELNEQRVAELTATNQRRTWLEIEKDVTYDDPSFPTFDDELFEFTISVTDPNGDDIWFSVKESKTSDKFITTEDGLVVTGATPEDGSAYFFAPSGSTFTVKMKKGWNLRIINLLTDTTYTIEETNINEKFEFSKTKLTLTVADNNPEETEGNSASISGTIETANTSYSYLYVNKNVGIDIKVNKIWVDNGEDDRPDSITVTLSNGDEGELNADNNWEYTFTGLPIYAEDGSIITYDVDEVEVDNYQSEKSGSVEEGFTFTNTLLVEITITKTWDDNEDEYGNRPESIEVQILANGEAYGDPIELTAEDDWTTTIELLAFVDGVAMEYSIDELTVDGYTTDIEDFDITNTTETTEITITKTWDDNEDEYGNRPDSIEVQILANGEAYGDPVELTAKDDWTITIELPTYIDGEEITYTIDELTVDGYTTEISDFDITNTTETTEITITKTWDDNEDEFGNRPDSIEVQILANGEVYGDPIELTAEDDWTITIELPTYIDGEEITYTIDELTVDGYTTDIEDFDITNTTETTEITITKTWDDNEDEYGSRPDSIEVQILANGEAYGDPIEITSEDEWTITIELPTYIDGEEITYTIDELTVDGYTTFISNYDITNTTETTEITITKTWDDNEDEYGNRPESIEVQILANGEAYGDPIEITAENDWTITIELPTYIDGEEIEYTIDELTVDGYTTEISDFDITNTTETTEITITKTWDDNEDEYGNRPDSIEVQILANGEAYGDPIELTAENDWTITIELPTCIDGEEIEYTIDELTVDGYTTEISDFDITNTTETTEITITKTWADNEDEFGNRPDSIEVQILANGEAYGDPVELTAQNDWTITIELPTYIDGEEIEYTIDELTVDGYTTEISDYDITNTTETTEITITKTWDDNDDDFGNRPDSIEVQILANGEAYGDPIEITAEDDWTITIELPTYIDGEEIEYTIDELTVDGYTTEISDYDITNTTETTEITITKTWNDSEDEYGNRPESIEVQILANGEAYGDPVELTAQNDWTITIELPTYIDGEEIEYTIDELTVDGYTTEISDYDITNTTETTEITITKTWDDNDDEFGNRPDSIEVQILANGEAYGDPVELTAENDWTITIELPTYIDGEEIEYTIDELTVDGYTTEISDFDITNTLETIDVTVTKIWEDEDNEENRPEAITVILLANGDLYEQVDITADTKWTYTFEGLPTYINGEEVTYTVDEIPVDNYITTITGDQENGFEITNLYEAVGTVEEPPHTGIESNMSTISNVHEIILFISMITLLYLRKKTYINL